MEKTMGKPSPALPGAHCGTFGPHALQYLEEEYRKGAREDDPMPPVQPYHYGSHYSNSGTVLHFLVRMPPFTKMFLAYQGKDCWVTVMGQSLSKLIRPQEKEFFLFPQQISLQESHRKPGHLANVSDFSFKLNRSRF